MMLQNLRIINDYHLLKKYCIPLQELDDHGTRRVGEALDEICVALMYLYVWSQHSQN
jgi:hypothetical protein